MKTFIIIFSIVVCSSLFLLFVLGKYSQKGNASGLVNGSLLKCSAKPNCVCSEFTNDMDHFIQPVEYSQNVGVIDIPKVSATIQEMGGTIRNETDNYIAATFASKLFGFVDDLEIRVDQDQKVLHIRSASRVGYGDGGVNRKRVELFRKLYKNNLTTH